MQRFTVTGRMVDRAELRYTPNGAAVATFAVATNRREKTGGEWIEKAHFFDCKAWGKRAEALEKHMAKGDPILVEGDLVQERWKDKGTGQTRTRVKLEVTNWEFFAQKGGSGSREERQSDFLDDEDVAF